jgi:DNA modification methylase
LAISIRIGDALASLRAMPADSVHCCVTSPPYWGLRDYGTPPQVWGGDPECQHRWSTAARRPQSGGSGPASTKQVSNAGTQGSVQRLIKHASCERCGAWRGSLGLEPTYQLYVDHLVAVLREVRRVLRPDGTLWLNLGDCYAMSTKGAGGRGKQHSNAGSVHADRTWRISPGLKPKDLVGIPWRVAFALQDDGWWLRRDHIWSKPNPMPESTTDRCTSSHEYLFHLTKSARYFFDHHAIKEPCASGPSDLRKMVEGLDRIGGKHKTLIDPLSAASAASKIGRKRGVGDPSGRNKRSVWTIATSPYPEAHFATFPPALVEPCILAGTSERGVCSRCAAPWRRVTKTDGETTTEKRKRLDYSEKRGAGGSLVKQNLDYAGGHGSNARQVTTLGWRASCNCPGTDTVPAIVLDPFLGSGTTAMVADRLGRDCIGLELRPAYAAMAQRRTRPPEPRLRRAA